MRLFLGLEAAAGQERDRLSGGRDSPPPTFSFLDGPITLYDGFAGRGAGSSGFDVMNMLTPRDSPAFSPLQRPPDAGLVAITSSA